MADANFCSKCGTRLDPQARFCASCGNTVVVPAVAAVPPPAAYQPGAAPAPAMAPPPLGYQPVATPAPAMAPQPPQAMGPMGYPQAAPQQYGAVPPGYVPQTTYAGVPPAAVATPYAGFWMRVGAYLVDFVI